MATRATPDGALVLLAGAPVFVVTPADVDTTTGESMGTLAAAAASRLRMAVEEVRESGSVTAIVAGLALTLVATALLVIVLRLLGIGRRRLEARLGRVTVAARPRLRILAKLQGGGLRANRRDPGDRRALNDWYVEYQVNAAITIPPQQRPQMRVPSVRVELNQP